MFSNKTILQRLKFSFLIITSIIFILLVALAIQMYRINNITQKVANIRVPQMIQLEKISNKNNYMARAFRNLFILTDLKEYEHEKKIILDNKTSILKELELMLKESKDNESREILKNMVDLQTKFNNLLTNLVDLMDKKDKKEAYKVYVEIRPIFRNLIQKTEELTEIQGSLSKSETANASENMVFALILIVAGLMITTITSMFFGKNTTQYINQRITDVTIPIKEIEEKGNLQVQLKLDINDEIGTITKAIHNTNNTILEKIQEIDFVLSEISSGNLKIETKTEYKGDFNEIKVSLEKTKNSLIQVITTITSAVDQVTNGAQEIVLASVKISEGASEQAASVEEISASIEQILAGVEQNTSNSIATDKIASSTSEKTLKGKNAIYETLDAMKSIVQKIGFIEEIATQTNLLAVNAAIESARAGEHGLGFSVVSSEVRKLAQSSKKTAEDIKELAARSLSVAENAVLLFETITPDVQRTADLVQEISEASKEQSISLNQINTAINQLNYVTQTNASASEELASTGELLKQQSQELKKSIEYFRL